MGRARSIGFGWSFAALMAISIAAGSGALGCGSSDAKEDRQSMPAQCGVDEVAVEGKGCQCAPGLVSMEGGGCRPAGLPCDPGATTDVNGCKAPGVPVESCGQGFKADGTGGCV